MPGQNLLYLVTVVVVLVFTTFVLLLSRYRKCPSDKIMVIYGKVGDNPDGTQRSAKFTRWRGVYLADYTGLRLS